MQVVLLLDFFAERLDLDERSVWLGRDVADVEVRRFVLALVLRVLDDDAVCYRFSTDFVSKFSRVFL
jgi:hypothetical protein